jgi:hypothetical protein
VKSVSAIQLTGAAYTTVHWVAGAGAGSGPDVSGTGGTNTVEKISEQDYEDKIAS